MSIDYTAKEVKICEDAAFEQGMRVSIDILDGELALFKDAVHIKYAIQRIENHILKDKIDKLSAKIEELQEKIIRYEKG